MLGNKNDKKGLLDKIDEFFLNKKPSESSLVYAGVVLAIGYGVYSFVYPITDEGLKSTKSSIASATQKISTENSYLSSHSMAMINNSKNKLKHKEVDYDNTLYKMSYVDNKLTELSYLLFDDKSWAGFVDNISELAKKYSVDIKEISNKFYDPTYQKITHVAEVEVVSTANTKNMIKFLNAIEESQLVIDVNNIKLDRPENAIEGSFKIAVWGMKY